MHLGEEDNCNFQKARDRHVYKYFIGKNVTRYVVLTMMYCAKLRPPPAIGNYHIAPCKLCCGQHALGVRSQFGAVNGNHDI